MAFITPRRKCVARIAWRRHDRHPVPSMIGIRPAQVLPPASLTPPRLAPDSKSALGKHISVLAEAGYVAQRRAVRDARQRVWLHLTETGRSAYRSHVAALHQIVGHAQR